MKFFLPFLMSVSAVLGEEADVPPQTTADILRHAELELSVKLKRLKSADVTAELDAAIKRGDHRFFDLTGFGAVPGVENWTLKLEKQYGTMVVGSGFGMLVEDDQETYEKALADYAAAYNRQLFERLGAKPEPAEDLSKLPLDQRIDALISRLVLSEEEGDRFVFTPAKGTLRSDRRMIALEAVEELIKIGYPAFRALAASLEDRRQSISMESYKRKDVGMVCYHILTHQIYAMPKGYSYSLRRQGSDGKSHRRPGFGNDVFPSGGLAAWLESRRGKPLVEIQIEALSWVLDMEKQIGARTEEERQIYIAPLEQRLDELKKTSGARDEPPP